MSLTAKAGLAQGARGAAGRDQFHSVPGEFLRKIHQSGLIGNTQQGPLNMLNAAHLVLSFRGYGRWV